MLISVIIPNWNGKHHLDDCLSSLRQQTYTNNEIIVVDNGSTDGSQAYIDANFPEVTLVNLPSNKGFTGACNRGYAYSKGDIILLLNNDTAVEPTWLAAIANAFSLYPRVGSVASKMLLFDERHKLHAAGDFMRMNGLPGNRGVWQLDHGQFDREEAVFSACGGAAAYRRTALEEIGFLDDAFFFSCEDVDIGWRMQLADWQVLYVPSAVVYHKLKASGDGVTASFYDGRNYLYLLAKNYPTTLFKKHWQKVLTGQINITIEACRHWRGAAARSRLKGQIAGLVTLPLMLIKRKTIQKTYRRVDNSQLVDSFTDTHFE